MRYYSMYLLQNHDRFRYLGRLNNDYLVDKFSRIEDERLQYRCQGHIDRPGGENDINYNLGPDGISSKAWVRSRMPIH